MRILVLTNLYPNPYQPHRAPWNRQQLRAVASQGHEVRIISPIAWMEEWREKRRQGRQMPPSRRVTLDGITIDHPRYLYPPKVLRSWYGRCFLESVRASFRRALDAFQPDVMLAPWAYPDGWAAVRLAARDALPVVIKVHGSDVLTLDEFPERRRGTLAALRQAHAIVAVSQHLRDELGSIGIDTDRVHVVYNGIDHERFFPGDRAEARRMLNWGGERQILFVGNLVPVKQVDVLLEACRRMMKSSIAFVCHIAGDGPLRRELEATAARNGLAEQVKFHGVVAHQELPAWYRAADVVALPSRSEGVPNVLLEAMACGTPFVASRVGGIPGIAGGPPNRLVEPGDPAALGAALRQTLSEKYSSPTFAFEPSTWNDSAALLVHRLGAACAEFVRMGGERPKAPQMVYPHA